jgi:hypothetical protein
LTLHIAHSGPYPLAANDGVITAISPMLYIAVLSVHASYYSSAKATVVVVIGDNYSSFL